MPRKKTAADKPKISVWSTARLMRRIRLEKVQTGLTIEAIVNERLALSYRDHPDLRRVETVAP